MVLIVRYTMNQAKGGRANENNTKWKYYIMTGIIISCSIIMNNQKSLEQRKYYNDLAMVLGILNTGKDANVKQ